MYGLESSKELRAARRFIGTSVIGVMRQRASLPPPLPAPRTFDHHSVFTPGWGTFYWQKKKKRKRADFCSQKDQTSRCILSDNEAGDEPYTEFLE